MTADHPTAETAFARDANPGRARVRPAFLNKGEHTIRPAFFVEEARHLTTPAFAGAQDRSSTSPAFGLTAATDPGLASSSDVVANSTLEPQNLGAEDDLGSPLTTLPLDNSMLDPALESFDPPPAPSHAEAEQGLSGEDEGGEYKTDEGENTNQDLSALIEALDGAQANLAEEAKEAAIALGIEIARRILNEHVEVKTAPLRAFVDDALGKAPRTGPVRLFLAPGDVERMEELESDAWHSLGRTVTVNVDSELDLGDCRLEAPGVSVDGRLKTRIDRLAQAARSALGTEAVVR